MVLVQNQLQFLILIELCQPYQLIVVPTTTVIIHFLINELHLLLAIFISIFSFPHCRNIQRLCFYLLIVQK